MKLNLWTWEGTIERGPYAVVGVLGFAIKHNLDRIVGRTIFHRRWSLFNYWIPFGRAVRVTSLSSEERDFLFWMIILSLPFIWIGVALTFRRLRALGAPLWLVALFFVPYLNLLFFLILCVYPSQTAEDLLKPARERENRTLNKIIPQSKWGSAAMALLCSSVIGLGATLLSVKTDLSIYGIGLFVALPFCLGLISVLLYGYHEPRDLGSCLAVAVFSILLLGALLLGLAIEGAICLLVAAPIGLTLGLIGGLAGYSIQRRRWNRLQTQATFGAVLLFLPLLMGAEGAHPREAPLLQVQTQIEIAARPETVWRYLVSFSTLPRPTEWPFRVGIAYPLRSTLQGTGLAAHRECQFSTGKFVEPIRFWEKNRRLVFTISGEPPVMQEMSPYGHIHTRHIDEHDFQAQDAEFLLTPLANGHTLLSGTSRYRNRMWPVAYWRLWSDAIVHQIHLRVFRHIKQLSEAAESKGAAAD